jgi:hypothetical protein
MEKICIISWLTLNSSNLQCDFSIISTENGRFLTKNGQNVSKFGPKWSIFAPLGNKMPSQRNTCILLRI